MGQEMGNPLIGVAALCHLARLQVHQGRLHGAYELLERALKLATDAQGRRLPIASKALIGLGELEREWNDLEVAADHLSLTELVTGSTRVRAELQCDGPCLLVVARPWSPGWSATVDGARTSVIRANLAGLGVASPAGTHTVELRYRPWTW